MSGGRGGSSVGGIGFGSVGGGGRSVTGGVGWGIWVACGANRADATRNLLRLASKRLLLMSMKLIFVPPGGVPVTVPRTAAANCHRIAVRRCEFIATGRTRVLRGCATMAHSKLDEQMVG